MLLVCQSKQFSHFDCGMSDFEEAYITSKPECGIIIIIIENIC